MRKEAFATGRDKRASVISWAFYDWGSTAFPTAVVVSFFPVLLNTYWADPGFKQLSTFYLGLANSTSGIALVLLAPLLGAIADKGSARKKFLAVFAFFGITMIMALSLVGRGNWPLAVFLFIIASFGYSGANLFYDSLLLTVSSKKNYDFVSSFGDAMGFLGGGIVLAIAVLLYQFPRFFGVEDRQSAVLISFIVVGLWWALFALPLIFFVREPPSRLLPVRRTFSLAWEQLRDTFGRIKQYKQVIVFLAAYWLYIDGANTVSKMAVDYGIALGFPAGTLIGAVLLVQFISFPATLLYLRVAAVIGTKRAVQTAIAGYGLIAVLGFFVQKSWHLYVIAVLIALFQGSIYALSRSLYSRIIPPDSPTEFFGFYSMVGKFATIIGPLYMGVVTYLTGSNRIGISSILLFFLAGGWLLSTVNIED